MDLRKVDVAAALGDFDRWYDAQARREPTQLVAVAANRDPGVPGGMLVKRIAAMRDHLVTKGPITVGAWRGMPDDLVDDDRVTVTAKLPPASWIPTTDATAPKVDKPKPALPARGRFRVAPVLSAIPAGIRQGRRR